MSDLTLQDEGGGRVFFMDRRGIKVSPYFQSHADAEIWMAQNSAPVAMTEFYIGQIAPDSAFRAVFQEGRQVSPAMRDEAKLRAIMAEKQRIAGRGGLRLRRCLSCGAKFPSEGPHERLCPTHRKAASAEGQDQGWPSYRARMGM